MALRGQKLHIGTKKLKFANVRYPHTAKSRLSTACAVADVSYSMQIRRQQLDAQEKQRQNLSRSSGSGSIRAADVPGYMDDFTNIWDNPYSPLGKKIGQTAVRTLVPSQYEYEFRGGYRRDDAWKLRVGAVVEVTTLALFGAGLFTRAWAGSAASYGLINYTDTKQTTRDVALGAGFATTAEFFDQTRSGDYNVWKLTTAAGTGAWTGYKSSGKGLVQQMWYSGLGASANTALNNTLFGENNSVLFSAGVGGLSTGLGGKVGEFAGSRAYDYFKFRGNNYMPSVGYSRAWEQNTSNIVTNSSAYYLTYFLKP